MMKEEGSLSSLHDVSVEEQPVLLAPLLGGGNRCISVVAPANMEEGFTFEASVDGRMFVVTVPMGGVLVGETILVEYPQDTEFLDYPINPHRIPNYYWRDGLCDCTAHGKCHPTIFCGFLCPPLLSAQVMTRYWNVDHNNNANNASSSSKESQTSSWNVCGWYRSVSPFRKGKIVILLVGFVFIVLKISFLVVKIRTYLKLPDMNQIERSKNLEKLITDSFLSVWGMVSTLDPLTTIIFMIQFLSITATIVVVARLRHQTRRRYTIAPTIPQCGDNVCDDILLSTACLCCTVTQIARHTANYNQYEAALDTETGLTPDAPPITTTTQTNFINPPLPNTTNTTPPSPAGDIIQNQHS